MPLAVVPLGCELGGSVLSATSSWAGAARCHGACMGPHRQDCNRRGGTPRASALRREQLKRKPPPAAEPRTAVVPSRSMLRLLQMLVLALATTLGLASSATAITAEIALRANSEFSQPRVTDFAAQAREAHQQNALGYGENASDSSLASRAGGQWARVAESMSARALACQGRITGRAGEAFIRGGVKFDGIANGVLLEAKGPGYASFVRNGSFQPWFSGAKGLVSQAQRQLAAAGGSPIQWHFVEEAAANATRALFQQRGISGRQEHDVHRGVLVSAEGITGGGGEKARSLSFGGRK